MYWKRFQIYRSIGFRETDANEIENMYDLHSNSSITQEGVSTELLTLVAHFS